MKKTKKILKIDFINEPVDLFDEIENIKNTDLILAYSQNEGFRPQFNNLFNINNYFYINYKNEEIQINLIQENFYSNWSFEIDDPFNFEEKEILEYLKNNFEIKNVIARWYSQGDAISFLFVYEKK